jgi:hypothetical protein
MRTKGLYLALVLSAISANAQRVAAVGEPKALEAIRKYALSYVQNLPDYTCVQVSDRIDTAERAARTHDVIEEELSFVGGKERYKVTKVNGFPAANTSHEKLGGTVSQGEFGSLLKHIFDPETGTTFRSAGQDKLQGRTMNVLNFSVPQSKGYTIYDGELKRDFILAYEGSVYTDAETNAVMRLTMRCVNIPRETRLIAAELTLEYRPTRLADREYILPSHFELVWQKRKALIGPGPQEDATNAVDFKLYRRFSAAATIDFTENQPAVK